VEVLKRYPDGYGGRPVSDPEVLQEAGLALGGELIERARETLKDRSQVEGKRGEYHKFMNAIGKHEKAMQAAAVFAGPDADDVLIELWKFALDLCENEYQRLVEEYNRKVGGRSRVTATEFSELEQIRKKVGQVIDAWREHLVALAEYGFYHSRDAGLEELPDQK
jgi:hypothetical protein